jgi:hypothetical protein
MTSRCQFVIVFVATLMIATLFNFPFFNPAQATNQHLKQAGSAQGVNDILAKWGEAGQEAARRNLALDWLFIVVYAATWIAAGRHFWPNHIWTKFAVGAGLAGAVADIVENVCLRTLLQGNVTDKIAQTCKQASSINVALFFLTALYFMVAAIASGCRTFIDRE